MTCTGTVINSTHPSMPRSPEFFGFTVPFIFSTMASLANSCGSIDSSSCRLSQPTTLAGPPSRLATTSHALLEMSMPIHLRFSSLEDDSVVPQPQNGSSTTSSSRLLELMIFLSTAMGFCVG